MKETVNVDLWRDGRAAVLSALQELPERQRSRVTSAVLYALRAAGFFRGWIEYHYSATAFATLIGRSDEYVMKLIRREELAPVCQDARGWMIPASTGQAWLDARTFRKNTTSIPIETGVSGEKNPYKEAGLGASPGDGPAGRVPDHGPVYEVPGMRVEGISTKRTRKRQQIRMVRASDAGCDAAATAQAPSATRPGPAATSTASAASGPGGGGSGAAEVPKIHMGHDERGFH